MQRQPHRRVAGCFREGPAAIEDCKGPGCRVRRIPAQMSPGRVRAILGLDADIVRVTGLRFPESCFLRVSID